MSEIHDIVMRRINLKKKEKSKFSCKNQHKI